MIQTQSQLYAQRAYQKVTAVAAVEEGEEGYGAENQAKYRTVALSFPSLVHTCGLAQALAFVKAKEEGTGFSADLEHVLGLGDLSEKSRTSDLLDYMQLSRQVMVASGWLKRYAEAMLKSEKKE